MSDKSDVADAPERDLSTPDEEVSLCKAAGARGKHSRVATQSHVTPSDRPQVEDKLTAELGLTEDDDSALLDTALGEVVEGEGDGEGEEAALSLLDETGDGDGVQIEDPVSVGGGKERGVWLHGHTASNCTFASHSRLCGIQD